MWHSTDLVQWELADRVFDSAVPEWAEKAVPRTSGIWAPDISYYNGLYHLYYSVSTFGSQHSVIGLAVNKTLNKSSADYKWEDRGMVIDSDGGRDNFNAIDPALALDADGNPYLFWGSYWTGIKAVKVDPETGKPVKDAKPVDIAAREGVIAKPDIGLNTAIEGAYVFRHDDLYYLFVSFDSCCDGEKSTYKVMVGRSDNILGPYFDMEGEKMLDGGGTLVLQSDTRWRGTGHNSVLSMPSGDWLVSHAYDVYRLRAARQLQVRPMYWQRNGWPVVGLPLSESRPVNSNRDSAPIPTTADVIGTWLHYAADAPMQQIELAADGTIFNMSGKAGKWSLEGRELILKWTSYRAPEGFRTDYLLIEPEPAGSRPCTYTGRSEHGTVIHGEKK